MKVDKLIISKEEVDIEFSGITLLTASEAERLPLEIRNVGEEWALRSPGYDEFRVCTVQYDGSIDYSGHTAYFESNKSFYEGDYYDDTGYDCESIGVRPALVICNPEKFSNNEKIVLPQVPKLTWTIFNGKALCDEVVFRCPFKEIDHFSEDKKSFFLDDLSEHPIKELNDYEYSDIKAEVEGWEKELGLVSERHVERGRAIDGDDFREIVEDIAEIFENFCRERDLLDFAFPTDRGLDKDARSDCWRDGSPYRAAVYNVWNNLQIHVNGEPFSWSYNAACQIAEGSISMFKGRLQDQRLGFYKYDRNHEILKGEIVKKLNEWGITPLKDLGAVMDYFDKYSTIDYNFDERNNSFSFRFMDYEPFEMVFDGTAEGFVESFISKRDELISGKPGEEKPVNIMLISVMNRIADELEPVLKNADYIVRGKEDFEL